MKYLSIIKFTAFFICSLSIIIKIFLKFLDKICGKFDLELILFNVLQNNKGVDFGIVIIGLKYLGIVAFQILLLYFIIYKSSCLIKRIIKSPQKQNLFNALFIIIIFALAVIQFSYVSYDFNQKSDVLNFVRQFASSKDVPPSEDFILQNYKVPDISKVRFTKKQSAVVILVESYEQSFFSEFAIPPLKQRISLKDAQCIKKYESASNMNFTIGALTAWHFGLPLKLPFKDLNEYVSPNGFLPNAKSVFDILHQNGFKLSLIMGSDSNFSGKKLLFEGHGNFVIKDKNYWNKLGYDKNENKGTGWGYSDNFTLTMAKDELQSLVQSSNPFVLVIELVDTHFPSGYSPKEFSNFGDIRDSIDYVGYEVNNFIKFVQELNIADLSLIVLGDHNFMGAPDFIKGVPNRYVFNSFYNVKKKIPKQKLSQKISAIDIAPTLLQVCGGDWDSNQFGLGISLFSEDKSLIEKMGTKVFNEQVKKKSSFYEKFY